MAPDTPANEAWRYGVDLFNARFYWEAHEAWEIVWRGAKRGGAAYWATKGMIQLTASLLTLYMCRTDASRHLALRGAELLERAIATSATYRQLELATVANLARARVVAPVELPRLEDAAFLVHLAR
jgi:hypothetical protein